MKTHTDEQEQRQRQASGTDAPMSSDANTFLCVWMFERVREIVTFSVRLRLCGPLLGWQQREDGNVTDHKPPGQPLEIYCTLNMWKLQIYTHLHSDWWFDSTFMSRIAMDWWGGLSNGCITCSHLSGIYCSVLVYFSEKVIWSKKSSWVWVTEGKKRLSGRRDENLRAIGGS